MRRRRRIRKREEKRRRGRKSRRKGGFGCRSVVEHLPTMCQALCSLLSTTKKLFQKRR
jgi:hypothetical protein